jgi:molecular chaperone DnaJ
MPSASAAAPLGSRPAQDFYDVLGVPRTADADAIRQAYRRRARELHPDVSTEPDAEERVRELNAAYAVLSDSQSRMLYDRFGYRGRGNGLGPLRTTANPREPVVEVEVDAFEAARGARREVRYATSERCSACKGTGRSHAPPCSTCNGKGRVTRAQGLDEAEWVHVVDCPDCGGPGRCPDCDGSGTRAREETLKIRIPAGVEDGSRLRVVDDPGSEQLLIQVRPIEDSLLVRIVAAALLVCALAFLAHLAGLP